MKTVVGFGFKFGFGYVLVSTSQLAAGFLASAAGGVPLRGLGLHLPQRALRLAADEAHRRRAQPLAAAAVRACTERALQGLRSACTLSC